MRFIVIFLTFLMVLFSGCQNEEEPNLPKDQRNESIDESFVKSHNTFGFNLLQTIFEDESEENLFISPTSVLVALSMLYNGADGMTQDEIAKTLQLEGIDVDNLNKANAAFLTLFNQETDDITVKLANSIWINDDFEFQEEFKQRMDKYYAAKTEAVDILDHTSVKKINDWVSQATNEKIEKMIQNLPSNFVALLINAIYLDAAWTIPFDKSLTEERSFYITDNMDVTVPLMMKRDHFNYLETDQFQAVQLPYGEKASIHMTVMLPKEDLVVDELLKTMVYDDWKKWQTKFSEQEGTVLLPKFTLEYETILNDYLIDLGMPSAFSEQADLTKLVKDSNDLFVSEVKQKSFLDVNEEGTEAAAATSIMIVEMSAVDGDEPFYMEVNRPFIITITDVETDAILFIGVIKDPS